MRPPAPADVEADLDRLVRRLRGLSAGGWAAPGRREAMQRLAAELLAMGEPGHELPQLPDHAMGDVVAVLGREAMSNGRRDEVAAAVRAALEATR